MLLRYWPINKTASDTGSLFIRWSQLAELGFNIVSRNS